MGNKPHGVVLLIRLDFGSALWFRSEFRTLQVLVNLLCRLAAVAGSCVVVILLLLLLLLMLLIASATKFWQSADC